MIINNNMMAKNSHRMLSINAGTMGKSTEKLSSGLRVNRAADDAAGLSISEKMRGQIRGLTQASRNSQDAISVVQTAEGALDEAHSILQRMRQLAVQSANDSNVKADRDALQLEVTQLTEELDRIAGTTEFNTQKLLDGSFKDKVFHVGANKDQNIEVSVREMSAKGLGLRGGATGTDNAELTKALNSAISSLSQYQTSLATREASLKTREGELAKMKGTKATLEGSLANKQGSLAVHKKQLGVMEEELKKHEDKKTQLEEKLKTAPLSEQANIASSIAQVASSIDAVMKSITGKKTTIASKMDSIAKKQSTISNKEISISIKLGSIAKNKEKINEVAAKVKSFTKKVEDLKEQLGMGATAGDGIKVSTQVAANAAIKTINAALTKVSTQRSELGAIQNRMEHTIRNLDNAAENTQAAESRIRDIDMAKEMSEFTKKNILTQASQAMLAQANQLPQQVLQLLR